MISSIKLKFGRTPGAMPSAETAAPITVFVGPNNSGKSKALSEIAEYCRTGSKSATALLIDEISFFGSTEDEARAAIARITQDPNPGEYVSDGNIIVGGRHGRNQVNYNSILQCAKNPSDNIAGFCQWYLSHYTLALDGPSRIVLAQEQPAGNLQSPPATSLQVLFRDDNKRREVRRIISEAFGMHFVIDPTNLGQLRIRMSRRPPASDSEERALHTAAIQFYADAQSISDLSDGVKAFTGIITELIAGDPKILLIDEPEAFLHPSLATKLGFEISRAAVRTNKRVFVSTHSPAFVMGCIQSGAPVNIVRLTYRSGVATSRILPSNEIIELMRNPLLRSTGVLSGLFYEFVVVTESDADRAFYQEVNERLLRFRPDWGIPNCLFINAQNKQTVHTIIRPLRHLGIPAVGIVDIDVLKDGGANWTNLLSGANVPSIAHSGLAAMRTAVKGAMEKTTLNMKRDGGINILGGDERQAACDLLHQLGCYGVFTVPGGELESWLKHLGATGHGPSWLINVFEAMGEDQNTVGYVKPTDGDVWEFMRKVKEWLVDPNRKGIPN